MDPLILYPAFLLEHARDDLYYHEYVNRNRKRAFETVIPGR